MSLRTKYEADKIRFSPSESSGDMWSRQVWVSFHTSTWRKNTSSSFCREGRQRSGSRFWRRMRQTQGDMTKSSTPHKWLECLKQLTGRVYQISSTMTHFFQLQAARLLIKQCSAREWLIPSFVPAAILPKFTWNMNHLDVSLFSPHTHGCHMLSRGAPFFFQASTGRRALKPSEKKEKRKRQVSFRLPSFGG